MKFKGFGKGVPDKVNSWHLPDRIVKLLLRGLTPLVDFSPNDLPFDSDGLYYGVRCDDNELIDHRYAFNLRICRDDSSFWVADISGYELNADNDVVWDSESRLL